MTVVHQPRMKVFALGLDENQKAERAVEEKKDSKIPIESVTSTVPTHVPPPTIVLAKAPAKKYGFACGLLSWFIGAFCLVLLCLAISEVAYHRQRDQAFLRLKWAELRQRMLGYELLSQQQELDRMALEKQSQPQQQIEALPMRLSKDPVKPQIFDAVKPVVDTKTSNEGESKEEELTEGQKSRLGFLQNLMVALRKQAEKMGLSGDMQVHVVEVKPIDVSEVGHESNEDGPVSMERAIADGFGEVAVPRQFGQVNDDYDYGRHTQFDRNSMRRPFAPFNRYDDNNNYGDYEENPQMRITHHFDGEARSPKRVVTELFGEETPHLYRNLFSNPQPSFYWQQPPQNPWQQQDSRPMNWQQNDEVLTNQWDRTAQAQAQPMVFSFPQQNNFPQQMQNPPNPMFSFAQQSFQQPNNQQQQQIQPVQNQMNTDNQRPWYMGDDQKPQPQMWQNDDWMRRRHQMDAVPFQPNPAASSQWVDGSANVDVGRVQVNNQFDAPMDMIADGAPDKVSADSAVAPPSTIISAIDENSNESKFNVKAWLQPQGNDQTENVISPDAQLEPIDDKFLPIRTDDKTSEMSNDAVVDAPSHLFQIDDPSSFRH